MWTMERQQHWQGSGCVLGYLSGLQDGDFKQGNDGLKSVGGRCTCS